MSYDIPDELVVDAPSQARPGIYSPDKINDELDRLYVCGGLPRGDRSGWDSVNELYTVAGGQWTLVTGIPGMGKSEWVDALAVNLAEQYGWHFGVYSPENHPLVVHATKILEKRVRKPFNVGVRERISPEEKAEGRAWVHEHFTWVDPDSLAPIEIICHALAYARRPRRKFGMIIDPWNSLDHQSVEWRGQMTETEYVADTLTRVTRLLRAPGNEDVHVWIVAHPKMLYRGKDGKMPVPTGYDVSGSAHWFNKADNIITITRDKSDGSKGVDVTVQKVRFKHCGRVGVANLNYDLPTGRYEDWQ